jgi:hypothetical protein
MLHEQSLIDDEDYEVIASPNAAAIPITTPKPADTEVKAPGAIVAQESIDNDGMFHHSFHLLLLSKISNPIMIYVL